MRKIFAGALFLGVYITAIAQKEFSEINEVEVQGKLISETYKNLNQNIEVLTRKEIEQLPAASIDEVLQFVSGVDIRRRGANGVQSDVTFRGSSFEQVLILINGIRMNDSQTGHNSLNIPVNLDNVERIEVIKGPAARRFGQNAYAGVINIITKSYAGKRVKITADGGDYSLYGLGFTGDFGTEKFSNSLQASTSSSEGYRHNTDFEIRNVFYQNQIKINRGNVQMQAGFSEKKFGANGFYASAKATEQYEEMQASIVSVAAQQDYGRLKMNTNAYWRRGQDFYLYDRNNEKIYRNMHIGNNVGGEISANYTSNLGVTALGVELRKEFLVSNNLGTRNRFVTQTFLEHHFSLLNKKLQITPGISWANYSTNGNFFYPGLDVGYHINNAHKIYGNVGKVHRVPSFTDLYYVSKTEVGNPNLLPENALSSEVGYQFLSSTIQAKASVFMRDSNNSIDWIKNQPEDSVWRAENVGKINTKGFEAEFKHQLNSWLNYGVSYTYIDSKMRQPEQFTSRYVIENLRHQVVSSLGVKFLRYFSNEISYRYIERVTTGSYQLLDEKLSFKKDQLGIHLTINNLTNVNYTEAFGVPMPRRWFQLGFSYELKFDGK